MKKIFWILLLSAPFWFPLLHHFIYEQSYKKNLFHEEAVQDGIVLILGAGIKDEQASAILEDRLITGLELQKLNPNLDLLISGTQREVLVMDSYLKSHGAKNIIIDPKGYRTFESLKKLKELISSYPLAYIVSQDFHLARCGFLAKALGLPYLLVKADRRHYLHIKQYQLREIFAQLKSWFDYFSLS